MKLSGILGRTIPLAPRQRIAAFTLLELLVVVAVIGLLAGITAPSIRGMVQGKTLSSGHRQLTDDLNRARQRHCDCGPRSTLFSPRPMSGKRACHSTPRSTR